MELLPASLIWSMHILQYESTVFTGKYEENVYTLWVRDTDKRWYKTMEIYYRNDGLTTINLKGIVTMELLMSIIPEIEKRCWQQYISR